MCSSGAKDAKTAQSLNKIKDRASNAMNTGGIAVTSATLNLPPTQRMSVFEVALAEQPPSKTPKPKIKDFASMMVTDHGKANDELTGIFKTKNITPPTKPDNAHQKGRRT